MIKEEANIIKFENLSPTISPHQWSPRSVERGKWEKEREQHNNATNMGHRILKRKRETLNAVGVGTKTKLMGYTNFKERSKVDNWCSCFSNALQLSRLYPK
jgi:uncharacterized protein YecA (UPF0149 family)